MSCYAPVEWICVVPARWRGTKRARRVPVSVTHFRTCSHTRDSKPRTSVVGSSSLQVEPGKHRVNLFSHCIACDGWRVCYSTLLKKPSNSYRNNFGKITKKRTSYDIKKHRITKFFCVIFFHFNCTFLHSLNVIKWGKPIKSKFALYSIFTILALARFSLAR